MRINWNKVLLPLFFTGWIAAKIKWFREVLLLSKCASCYIRQPLNSRRSATTISDQQQRSTVVFSRKSGMELLHPELRRSKVAAHDDRTARRRLWRLKEEKKTGREGADVGGGGWLGFGYMASVSYKHTGKEIFYSVHPVWLKEISGVEYFFFFLLQ